MKLFHKIIISIVVVLTIAWGIVYYMLGVDYGFIKGFVKNWLNPSTKEVQITPTETTKKFTGFGKITFVSGLNKPTSLAFDDNGHLFVSELGGSIWRYKKAQNSKAGKKTLFASGFNQILGILAYQDKLYVSSRGMISYLVDKNDDGVADSRKDIVTNLPVGRHQNDGMAIKDGKIYWGEGSRSDRGEGGIVDKEASVLRANLDGSNLEVFATGLRNTYDLAFHPETEELFGPDNGQDVPSSGVPDELNVIQKGKDYGWPGCWGIGHGSDCAGTVYPIAELEEHSSADGIAFYTGNQFPASYKNNIFIALWGSNSGDPDIGRKVIRVQLSGKGPNYKTKVTTFAKFNHSLDVVVGPDGALYVADYGAGNITRIVAKYRK